MGNIKNNYFDWNKAGSCQVRQYDHLSNRVIFGNAPKFENYYLLVTMKESESDEQAKEMSPIKLTSPIWLIPNSYTQMVQQIKFQICNQAANGTFEQHSAEYMINVVKSHEHEGKDIDVDPSPMYDVYTEYVDQKVLDMIAAAGDVAIDSTLSVSGAAADARAVGDAITAGKTFVVQVPGSAAVYSGSITAGDFAKALAAYTSASAVYAVKDGEVYQLSAVSSSTMTFTQMYHGTMNFIKQIQITSADAFTVINTALSSSAADTSYSNTASGLTATNVQDAIDENATNLSNTNERLVNAEENLNAVYDGKTVTVPSINKLNPNTVTTGQTIKSDGTLVESANHAVTDFIPLQDVSATNLVFTADNTRQTGRILASIYRCCFFASDKTTVLSVFQGNSSNLLCPINTDASYFRFSASLAYFSRNAMVEFVDSATDISDEYVAYGDVTTTEHGLTYIDGRLSAVESIVGDLDDLPTQVEQNTKGIADIKGISATIDSMAVFANGSIRSNTGAYDGGSNYQYRVATPSILVIDQNYVLHPADGYRVYIANFTDQNVFSNGGWVEDGYVLPTGSHVRIMIGKTVEDRTSTADVDTFCANVTISPQLSLTVLDERATALESSIGSVIDYGITWDWWITSNSIDAYGNAYIGYVDTDAYAGVIRRQPDGTMQYKRLEKLYNDDDHNACATIVLDDGRILVIGSYGHSKNNHIVCWRSVEPYSIVHMESFSFDIPQTGDFVYKTTYSQCFKYNGVLFNFLRCIAQGETSATGYACLVSSDDGETWTAYKAVYSGDPYISFAYASDDDKILKATFAVNPATAKGTIRAFTFDMSTQKFRNMAGTEIGQLVLLDGGSMADENVVHPEDMTFIRNQSTNSEKVRLLCTASAPKANPVFLYAVAVDSASSDFVYYLYDGTNSIAIGHSGTPFGNVHYICGACFGNDVDTIYYVKATTAKADGAHELHKVKMADGAVASDEIVTESAICMIRPLFLGNGELATVVGHYNDQNSDGTYKISFTAWELKPLFTRA